jgi:hypothetical protein
MTYPFESNQRFPAAAVNALPGRVLARAYRDTDSGAYTTTETPYLRLDGIPITSGSTYKIFHSPIGFFSTVANDQLQIRIRVSTSGAATITSTLIGGVVESSLTAGGIQRFIGFQTLYVSSTTGSLSVLMSAIRLAGTGSGFVDVSSTAPCAFWVEAGGEDPGDTGTDL